MLHEAVVEAGEQGPDRRVQLGDTEEAPISQRREDPPLGHEHVGLDDRLVPWMATPSGHDGGSVMPSELQDMFCTTYPGVCGGRPYVAELA